jgi:hypothetical protein
MLRKIFGSKESLNVFIARSLATCKKDFRLLKDNQQANFTEE